MATSLKLRRGTTTAHSTFTGAEGEVTVDTTKDTIVVHDGSTVGGFPLLKENNPVYTGTLTGGTGVINIGSGQVYKDASGNVGIGTSSPSTKLDVYSNTGVHSRVVSDTSTILTSELSVSAVAAPIIQMRKARGTTASRTAVNTGDNTGNLVWAAYGGTNFRNIALITAPIETYTSDTNISGALTFSTNSGSTATTEKMRITAAGDVGIGTSSPLGKVVVDGANLGNWSSANYGKQLLVYGINSNPSIGIYDSNSANPIALTNSSGAFVISRMPAVPTNSTTAPIEYMRIDSSGNVGIGTSSPSSKLHVFGNYISLADGTYSGYLGKASNVIASGAVGDLGLSVINNLVFGTGGSLSERMRIDSSGNVGIGTSSPSGRLHISDPTAASMFFTDSGAGTTHQLVADGEDYGIRANSAYNTVIGVLGGGTQAAYIRTNGTERMRIYSSGGVSIGNTTDSGAASLNVSGSISGGYVALADGTTAMPFGADNVVRVTPTATATYTTTVPAAGAICVLSILTSGTTSRTITFGTGFRSTGTLATGTVSARYFNITFVSDGASLIEMSRTVAIA